VAFGTFSERQLKTLIDVFTDGDNRGPGCQELDSILQRTPPFAEGCGIAAVRREEATSGDGSRETGNEKGITHGRTQNAYWIACSNCGLRRAYTSNVKRALAVHQYYEALAFVMLRSDKPCATPKVSGWFIIRKRVRGKKEGWEKPRGTRASQDTRIGRAEAESA
jgi:hypothetical protein